MFRNDPRLLGDGRKPHKADWSVRGVKSFVVERLMESLASAPMPSISLFKLLGNNNVGIDLTQWQSTVHFLAL